MEWINVKDKLPEDDKLKVIRYGTTEGVHLGIELSRYFQPSNLKDSDYYCWDFEFKNTQGTKVTHWFSLPELPNN